MQVKDLKGKYLDITDLWSDKKVVIGFLRHVGCRFCWQLAQQLNQIHQILNNNEISLICIVLASTEQGIKFHKDLNFKGDIYTIDSQEDSVLLYKNFKLKYEKDIINTLQTEKVQIKIQETINQKLEDHPFYAGADQQYNQDINQLDGVFVLGPGNQCDFSYKADYIGDHPQNKDILIAATGKYLDNKEIVHQSSEYWSNKLKFNQKIWPQIKFQDQLDKYFKYLFFLIFLSCQFYFFMIIVLIIMTIYCQRQFIFQILQKYKSLPKIVLLTPQEIDKMMLQQNLIKCDCSPIMHTIEKNIQIKQQQRRQSQDSQNMLSQNIEKCQNCQEFSKILCYLREFLSKPHPLVGREGPVCPFVPGSLKMNSIYMAVIQEKVLLTQDYIKKIVLKAVSQFFKLSPTDERSKIYKAIILIFPNIMGSQCQQLIDNVQKQLKPKFIKQGLMIGEFHQFNNSCGLRNSNFYPLRTPIPSLAIRHMVGTDIAFMTPQDCDIQTQIQFLESYILNFNGDKFRQNDIEAAKQKLENLKKI